MTVWTNIRHRLSYWRRDRAVRWSLRGFLAALVALTAVTTGWWPMRTHYQAMVEELHSRTRLLAESERAVAMAHQVDQVRGVLDAIEKKLAHGVEQADWIESVARIAAARKLKVMSQTVEEGKPQDAYLPMTLTVSLEGDYRGLRGLLEAVPSLPVFCVVRELHIETSADHSARLRAQLKLVAFRRQDGNTSRSPS